MSVVLALHGVWRWVVLVAAVAALVGAFRGTKGLVRFFPVAMDIQVLLGLILWVGNGWYASNNLFLKAIHPVFMLLALGAAHMGGSFAKKGRPVAAVVGTLAVSLLLVALAIPTNAWVKLY